MRFGTGKGSFILQIYAECNICLLYLCNCLIISNLPPPMGFLEQKWSKSAILFDDLIYFAYICIVVVAPYACVRCRL